MAVTTILFNMVCFALLSALICTTSASAWTIDGWALDRGRRETNANRMSRGLPPMPPRRLYNATRVGPALARRSTTPLSSQIAVTEVGGSTPLCWLGLDQTCLTPQSSGTTFVASAGGGSTTAQEITAGPGTGAGEPLLLADSSNELQGSGTGNYLYLISVPNTADHTAPGAVATYDSSNSIYYESSVFTIGSQGDITGTWVNSDGTSIPVLFFAYISGGNTIIYATGDITSFGSYPQVTLNFS